MTVRCACYSSDAMTCGWVCGEGGPCNCHCHDDTADAGDDIPPDPKFRGCWCPRDGGEALDCPVHGGFEGESW